MQDFKSAAEIADHMKLLMKLSNGVGLAAPQVGISERFFVMRDGGLTLVCINPEILSHGKDEEHGVEGCLSFPGLSKNTVRHRVITVGYLDENTKPVKRTFKGFEARIFQHELDHLNGVCLFA